jgi:hypothetical protein
MLLNGSQSLTKLTVFITAIFVPLGMTRVCGKQLKIRATVLHCLSVLQSERASANFEKWENEKRGGHLIFTIFSQPAGTYIGLVKQATCWRSHSAINGTRTTSEQRLTILLA